MSGKMLVFTAFIVLAALIGTRNEPLVRTAVVHDTVHVTDTIALRYDTVRVEERPSGFGQCALPAIVGAIDNPEHANEKEPEAHGHYRVVAGHDWLEVIATPPNARIGDVVCVQTHP